LFDCVDPGDRGRVAAEFEQCLAHLKPYQVEFRRAETGNEGRWIRIEARPRADRRVIGVVKDVSKRRLAEATLNELNERLETQVLARTAELRQSLNELNTFSYSVAHDLRAPLRSIIGFSQILLEDHNATLDDTIKHHLNNISAAGTRMAKLIDGLLNLSRLSRGKLELHNVNLSALATEIAHDLQASAPDRKVEFIIAPGLSARADNVLIQNVLENLLGNAWKFTARHASARIEFGIETIDGETAYFVSDDGAGFDMQYSDHLFHAFQRLHHTHEFEGTGIGLATVQRIVERHDGHVWANSAIEQGSKFYFTLAPRRN
jgi:light-regulated signal transduction histidine kinase (bacteriophytochrome)